MNNGVDFAFNHLNHNSVKSAISRGQKLTIIPNSRTPLSEHILENKFDFERVILIILIILIILMIVLLYYNKANNIGWPISIYLTNIIHIKLVNRSRRLLSY